MSGIGAVLLLLATAPPVAVIDAPPPMAVIDAPPPMAVIDERETLRREPPPHGEIGMSSAYRISDAVPQPRTMEFRRRDLDVGAAIGEHVIAHDEVYYVLAGEGEVVSDGKRAKLRPGMAAYLYDGAKVGIWQKGDKPLSLIIAYPVAAKAD